MTTPRKTKPVTPEVAPAPEPRYVGLAAPTGASFARDDSRGYNEFSGNAFKQGDQKGKLPNGRNVL